MPILSVTGMAGKVDIACASVVSIATSWISGFVTRRRTLIMDDGW